MPIPQNTTISTLAEGAYFTDSFSTMVHYQNQSALDLYLAMAGHIPSWINWLMSARNKIVAKLGLKNLGHLNDIDFNKPSDRYQLGDQIGIFTIHTNSSHEVILEDRDKHLNVKVSFYLEPKGEQAIVHASTVVHVHNMLGKIYMFFVIPVHKIIVPVTLKKLSPA